VRFGNFEMRDCSPKDKLSTLEEHCARFSGRGHLRDIEEVRSAHGRASNELIATSDAAARLARDHGYLQEKLNETILSARLCSQDLNPCDDAHLATMFEHLNTLAITTELYCSKTEKLANQLAHTMVLKALILECNHFLELDRQIKGQNDARTFETNPLCPVSPRLALYIHRCKHPVTFELKKSQASSLGYKCVPFLWETGLGTYVKRKMRWRLISSIPGPPHVGKNVELSRYEMTRVKFATSAYVLSSDYMLQTEAVKFLDKLRELMATPSSRIDALNLNDLPWTSKWIRPVPVVALDEELAIKIIDGLRYVTETSPRSSPGAHSEAAVGGLACGGEGVWESESLCDMRGANAFFFFDPPILGKTRPRTFLPLILEHEKGFRVYPYTRDRVVFEFYASCLVRVPPEHWRLLYGSTSLSSFIKLRSTMLEQRAAKIFKDSNGQGAHPFGIPLDHIPDRVDVARTIPPAVVFANNLVYDHEKNMLSLKTKPSSECELEFIQVFPHDFSQQSFGTEELPVLASNLETSISTELGAGYRFGQPCHLVLLFNNKLRDRLISHITPEGNADLRLRWLRQEGEFASGVPMLINCEKYFCGCKDGSGLERNGFSRRCALRHPAHFYQSCNRALKYAKWGGKIHRSHLVEQCNLFGPSDLFEGPDMGSGLPESKDLSFLWNCRADEEHTVVVEEEFRFYVDRAVSEKSVFGTTSVRLTECHMVSLVRKYLAKHLKIIRILLRQSELDLKKTFLPVDLLLGIKIPNGGSNRDWPCSMMEDDDHRGCSFVHCKALPPSGLAGFIKDALHTADSILRVVLKHPTVITFGRGVISEENIFRRDQLHSETTNWEKDSERISRELELLS
jgi:hypothetical protein